MSNNRDCSYIHLKQLNEGCPVMFNISGQLKYLQSIYTNIFMYFVYRWSYLQLTVS